MHCGRLTTSSVASIATIAIVALSSAAIAVVVAFVIISSIGVVTVVVTTIASRTPSNIIAAVASAPSPAAGVTCSVTDILHMRADFHVSTTRKV